MITSSELVFRYSATRTNTAANGGRMSKNAVTSEARQNFLPDWTLAEVTAGGTHYRKFFVHVANDDDLPLTQAALHLLGPSSAGDRVTLFAGTATDTQADIGTPTEYGAGTLQAALAAGATVLAVVLEDASQDIFHAAGQIYISDGSKYEYHDNVTIAKADAIVTITLAAGDMLAHDYAAGSVVASVLSFGTIQAAIGTPTRTTAAGTLDAAKILPDAIGCINQTITLTFTSATAFTAVSDVLGSLGTGSISTDFAPTNSDFGKPYCTVEAGAWGGAWAAGEVVRFATRPAAAGFWLKGVLPAGAAPAGSDTFGLRLIGGSN